MPELRKDPITGRWVIISTERGKRPTDFTDRVGPRRGSFCPFCPGNEDKTPPEVLAFRNPGGRRDGPGWQVRVVPNKFPALQIEGDMDRRGEGLYDKMNGIGAHEVIIETPEHDCELSRIPAAGIEQVLHAYRERMVDLKRDRRFRYLMLFKNHGEAAGATLEHGHTQIIATPIVPKRVQEEIDGARGHFALKERCIFCDMIAQERLDGRRIVVENDEFVAFAPFASRFAFETWLLPKRHESHFEEGDPGRIPALAQILRVTLMRIGRALNHPPYNFILHTSPTNQTHLDHYHWHFEIMPKLTKTAGFEWGTGFHINPTPPEEAAEYLREIEILDGDHAGRTHHLDAER
jgi:UDPglucose--hexose-1-phosphate uridylyltransferase